MFICIVITILFRLKYIKLIYLFNFYIKTLKLLKNIKTLILNKIK
jgi:hypothetical protein